MSVRSFTVGLVLPLALVAAPARAHHGKAFLLAETEEVPHSREGFFFSNQDLVHAPGENAYFVTPALMLGLGSGVALEVHGHFERPPGGGWDYVATAPALRLSLTPERSRSPFRLGLSAEYEFAHLEGEPDNIEARLILSYRQGKARLTGNLVAERVRRSGAETEWGYAAGFRPNVEGRLGLGVEAQGGLADGATHELVVGVYGALGKKVTVKVGAGKLFNSPARFTVRTGVVIGP
jgi:hypothetical protein